jgi:hypothetical protein
MKRMWGMLRTKTISTTTQHTSHHQSQLAAQFCCPLLVALWMLPHPVHPVPCHVVVHVMADVLVFLIRNNATQYLVLGGVVWTQQKSE